MLAKSRLISQTSPRTLQGSSENSENSQVTPEHPRIPSNFPRTGRSPRGGKKADVNGNRAALIYRSRFGSRYNCWPSLVGTVVIVVRCSIAYTKRRGAISVLRGGENVASLGGRKLTARRSAPVAATPCVATSSVPSARGDLSHARTRRAYSGAGRSGAERNGAAPGRYAATHAARAVVRKERRRGRSCEGCTQQLFEHP